MSIEIDWETLVEFYDPTVYSERPEVYFFGNNTTFRDYEDYPFEGLIVEE